MREVGSRKQFGYLSCPLSEGPLGTFTPLSPKTLRPKGVLHGMGLARRGAQITSQVA